MYGKLEHATGDEMMLSGSGLNTGAFGSNGAASSNNSNNSDSTSRPGNGMHDARSDAGGKNAALHNLSGLNGFNLNLNLHSLGSSTPASASNGTNTRGNHYNNGANGNLTSNNNMMNGNGNGNNYTNSHHHSSLAAGSSPGNASTSASTEGASPPPALNFVTHGSSHSSNHSHNNINNASSGDTTLKSHNSGSSFQLPIPNSHGPLQTYNSDGSLQTLGTGTLQHFGSGMSGIYPRINLFSSNNANNGNGGSNFGVRKSDDYLMTPYSSLGSRGAPQTATQQTFMQPNFLQQHQHHGRTDNHSSVGGLAFPQRALSGTNMFRSTSDPKALLHALQSNHSEMSESSVELLRTIIHNQDTSGLGDRNRATPLAASYAARSLSGGLGSGFSSAVAADYKKRRVECVSPIAERPTQRVQVQPSNFAEVLSKPVLESSMDDIIEAMSLINTGCSVSDDHKLKQLELVVKDRERRADRFHKKKSTPTDYLSSKIRSLKKKAYSTAASTANAAGAQKTNSSGQGCTIVVFHRKCQKHSRTCKMEPQSHSPSDIVISSEPVTRSSYGKWMNSYMKNTKIDV
ncbi:Hypothetical Protein FCC1311_031222 [Hondaea fermentalgiana]|uniref:Uncharacterized protein n=1 Tax=Hondaea fermentalgiana TaxID=2315210 RepID=A0A2R5G995_9STRA|nr:Hypothetical Protein FCC1311_031222 [Hondaea fermentalgiana]|eukprot:GBG26899.1 Hypothetical Protein FCC1311_031222 [Hondaea fermentalgiana]